MTTIVWAAAIVLFSIVEAVTAGLVSIWFAIGSIAALIAALAGAGFMVQTGIFLAVSAVALVLTRPAARKISAATPTNADRVLGTVATVTETIDPDTAAGTVYADGKIWSARSTGDLIPAGSRVQIEEIQGVKLLVKPIQITMEVS